MNEKTHTGMSTLKSYTEGPRWARFDIAIRNYAHQRGLVCEVERETAWLSETVRFKLTGTANEIRRARVEIPKGIAEWNK